MMEEMFPQSTISIKTEPGSWWLIVEVCTKGGPWLADVLARWGLMRFLDGRVRRKKLPAASLDSKLAQCGALARELRGDDLPLRVVNILECPGGGKEGVLLQVKKEGLKETMSIVRSRNIEDLQRIMRLG